MQMTGILILHVKEDNEMKQIGNCLQKRFTMGIALLSLLFCLIPAQAQAREGWTPQALPAEGVNTVFGDARYIDPTWLAQKVTVSYQGKSWETGMDAFKDIPVTLTNLNGKIFCTFQDYSVFRAYFGAINAELAALTVQNNVPVFDNGAGSYIYQGGQIHFEAKPEMADWLAHELENVVYAGSCTGISLELSSEFLNTITDSSNVSTSPDFVLTGSCTTSFKTSGANRSNNIVVGASRLNNLVVMPGQTVSVSDTLLPRTKANGYKEAGVYLNGVHTTGMGGGVCQISSTVYNAVMNAGLTVTERKPHSMPVAYLPKGQDAAIAAGSKDLKFRNDYSTPVVILTDTSNKTLTVNVLVLSQELNGRSFKLWSKQTGSLSADAYFTTYQDGEEVSTVFIGTSKYKPLREE